MNTKVMVRLAWESLRLGIIVLVLSIFVYCIRLFNLQHMVYYKGEHYNTSCYFNSYRFGILILSLMHVGRCYTWTIFRKETENVGLKYNELMEDKYILNTNNFHKYTPLLHVHAWMFKQIVVCQTETGE